jgi:molecular chaperone DnaK
MVDDAKLHEEEDNLRKAEIENRNNCDNAIYMAEKVLNDNDSMPDETKEAVRETIKDARSALESGDNDKITAALESLNSAIQKAGEEIYKAASQNQQQDNSGEDAASAEYEEAR